VVPVVVSQSGNLQKIRAFPKWESQKHKSLSHCVRDGSLQIDNENGNLYFLQKVDSELEKTCRIQLFAENMK